MWVYRIEVQQRSPSVCPAAVCVRPESREHHSSLRAGRIGAAMLSDTYALVSAFLTVSLSRVSLGSYKFCGFVINVAKAICTAHKDHQ